MPYSAYYLTTEGEIQQNLTRDEIRSAFESGKGLLWVDINEPAEEDSRLLEQVFNFHHLSIEDAVSRDYHPPKIDDFESDPRISDLHFRCYNFQAWHLAAVGLTGLCLREDYHKRMSRACEDIGCFKRDWLESAVKEKLKQDTDEQIEKMKGTE